ncbi:hypothetical protein, partial [Marinicella sediminis]|uniref:hypothetical protein n=1 Tax=Marinicella sediminis TaxID=1792834 RepID=UPI001E42E753
VPWFSPFKTMIFRDSAVISCGKYLKWPYDISEGVPVRAFFFREAGADKENINYRQIKRNGKRAKRLQKHKEWE